MSSIEERLLAVMLLTPGSVRELQRGKLELSDFTDPQVKQVLQYVLDGHNRMNSGFHHKLPALESVREKFGFDPQAHCTPDDLGHLDQWITDLRLLRAHTDLRALHKVLGEMIEAKEDSRRIFRSMHDVLDELRRKYVDDASGFGMRGIADFVREYWRSVRGGQIRGVPWPWDVLTRDTRGKGESDLIVFYGRMKSMKTWCLLYCACVDFLLGFRVAIWSREMDEKKLKLRLFSILGCVDYQMLKSGTLPPPIYRKAQAEVDRIALRIESLGEFEKRQAVAKKHGGDVRVPGQGALCVMCGPKAPKSVTELESAAMNYDVEVLYVDSFYHLTTPRSGAGPGAQEWQRITLLIEDLKQVALDRKFPVVCAAQANRMGEKLLGENMTEVAGSDAIAREADLVIRVIKRGGDAVGDADDDEEMQEAPERKIVSPVHRAIINTSYTPGKNVGHVASQKNRGADLALILAGNREGVLPGFTLHVQPGHTFQLMDRRFTAAQAQDWVKRDDSETRREIAAKRERMSANHEDESTKKLDLGQAAFQDVPKPARGR